MTGRFKRWTKMGLKIGAGILAVWLLLSAALYVVMCQPPIKFNHVMARTPMVAFFVLPFETLWLQARRGTLREGELAPDFNLKTADRTAEVRLSSLRGQKPVVLIFGSHT